ERKDLDKQVYDSLRGVINRGADLYNADNPAGCYYLYEGALLTLRPLLDQHADLQQIIDSSLKNAARLPGTKERAFVLRQALDRVRRGLRGDTAGAKLPATGNTLWDRLGGEANVTKVVDDFVAAAAADPKVNFTRGGKVKDVDVPRLKKLLVEQISDATGGPLKYTGRGMKEVHAGMGITDAEFDALAGHLKAALDKNGAKPEDAAAVLKVVESTRAQIVEKKPPAKKSDEKKPVDKKPG